jgi:hypothetical protein
MIRALAAWEAFSAAKSSDQKIAIYLETLDQIYISTVASGERERFDTLVAQLRERMPKVIECAAGKLHMDGGQRHSKKRKGKASTSVHPLAPDQGTLDCFIGEQQTFFSLSLHKVTGMFELLPAWLRFLKAQGLIDADRRKESTRQIAGLLSALLCSALRSIVDTSSYDPALAHWREEAGLAG